MSHLIALYCNSTLPSQQQHAATLSQHLQLPLLTCPDNTFHYLLVITDTHLELRDTQNPRLKPVYVDFLSNAAQYRYQQGGGKNQLIARAVGIKGNFKPTIIDATVGLGSDALVLTNLGCKIQGIERSPIIAALLQDGLARHQQQNPNINFSLTIANAIDYFTVLQPEQFPDVIYLDPMFPERQKSALVKKEMRLLRDLVGDDTDAATLLTTALARAKKRVVVKRPRLAERIIAAPEPDIVFKGASCRFDCYLVKNW
jgi:16S rRNA (guanine1516-N2)-methyltransferase